MLGVLNLKDELTNKNSFFESLQNLQLGDTISTTVNDSISDKSCTLTIYKKDNNTYDIQEDINNNITNYDNLDYETLLDVVEYIKEDSVNLVNYDYNENKFNLKELNKQLSKILNEEEVLDWEPQYIIKNKDNEYGIFDIYDEPIMTDISLKGLLEKFKGE